MRIITWNCNMSFARKRELMNALKPDILILQEVSKKDVDETPAVFKHWVGSSKHKGLAVICYKRHDYRIDDSYTNDIPWFLPLVIEDLDINILALWAHVIVPKLRYVRVTHQAIDHYKNFITKSPIIIAGDFNSNTIWDKKHSGRSHTMLVDRLSELGLKSAYHEIRQEEQGEELISTFFMYRNPAKGYHLDYVFLPQEMLTKSTIQIDPANSWLKFSDHIPVIVDIEV